MSDPNLEGPIVGLNERNAIVQLNSKHQLRKRFRKRSFCLTLSAILSPIIGGSALAQPAEPTFTIPYPLTAIYPQTGTWATSMAPLSDLNGDGVGELAIKKTPSALYGNYGVAIVSGATGDFLYMVDSSSMNFSENQGFGEGLAGIPDIDGDQIDDIIIGNPTETYSGLAQCGLVRIYSGATGAQIRQIVSPLPRPNGMFGKSVAGLPDQNGDGVGELLVGAPRNYLSSSLITGFAYLIDGATGVPIQTIVSPSPVGGGQFGQTVTVLLSPTAPPRLAVGAHWDSVNGTNRVGRVYIFSSEDGSLLQTLNSTSPESSGYFGAAICAIPDLDNDADHYEDIAVAATQESGPVTTKEGKIHIFSSSTGMELRSLTSPNGNSLGNFGAALAANANVAGPGVPVLLVGAPGEKEVFDNVGRTYLFNCLDGAYLRSYRPFYDSYSLSALGASVAFLHAPNPINQTAVVAAAGDSLNSGRPSHVTFYPRNDCNLNQILDDVEIAQGLAEDCDANGIPDMCDQRFLELDCNANQVDDYCEIALGSADDTNLDGIPDECPAGCNTVLDCNANQIPDADELEGNDCNADQIPDDCQIAHPYLTRISQNSDGEAANIDTENRWGVFRAAWNGVMSRDRRYVAFYSSASNLVAEIPNHQVNVYLKDTFTGGIRNIHKRPDGQPLTRSATESLAITPDGKFIVFCTEAPLLHASAVGRQLYLYNQFDDTLELVSRTTAGNPGNGSSFAPAISDDGRYIAFVSQATDLIANDTNGYADVLRLDRQAGTIELVSAGWRGGQSNRETAINESIADNPYMGTHQAIDISADGRYVLFYCNGANMTGSHGGSYALFVRDCETAHSEVVSLSYTGAPTIGIVLSGGLLYQPRRDMSPNGRYVVFSSSASNLVEDDPSPQYVDLYVRDRKSATTRRLNLPVTAYGDFLDFPHISDDGCFVTFAANIDGIIPGQPTDQIHLYRYDLRNDTIQLITKNPRLPIEEATDGKTVNPACTYDGQWILFTASHSNLIDGVQPSNSYQVYLCYANARTDCNQNLIPDDCELATGDCNANGILDHCECACPGDADGNGRINGADVEAFVSCLLTGCGPKGCICADMNESGGVSTDDLPLFVETLLLSANVQCETP